MTTPPTVNLPITIPVFNFDIVQGQDLSIPITYTVENIPDSTAGAVYSMELLSTDYTRLYDTLDNETTGRITITGINTFQLNFPNAITSAYKLSTTKTSLIYMLYYTFNGETIVLFQGTATVYRAVVK